jgi:hypothetical protein
MVSKCISDLSSKNLILSNKSSREYETEPHDIADNIL